MLVSLLSWCVLNLAIQFSPPLYSFLLSLSSVKVLWHPLRQGPYMKSCNLLCLLYHGMVNDMKQIRKFCNICRVLHRGTVSDTKQIRKSCNLPHLFSCDMVNDGEFSVTW